MLYFLIIFNLKIELFLWLFINNPKIKKSFDNINKESDKGKSYEYLERNEYKETINSILNDILAILELEK